jgi:hypothetical protein
MTLKLGVVADDMLGVASGSRNPDETRTGSTKQAFGTLGGHERGQLHAVGINHTGLGKA